MVWILAWPAYLETAGKVKPLSVILVIMACRRHCVASSRRKSCPVQYAHGHGIAVQRTGAPVEQVHVGAVFRAYPVDEISRDEHDSLFFGPFPRLGRRSGRSFCGNPRDRDDFPRFGNQWLAGIQPGERLSGRESLPAWAASRRHRRKTRIMANVESLLESDQYISHG